MQRARKHNAYKIGREQHCYEHYKLGSLVAEDLKCFFYYKHTWVRPTLRGRDASMAPAGGREKEQNRDVGHEQGAMEGAIEKEFFRYALPVYAPDIEELAAELKRACEIGHRVFK